MKISKVLNKVTKRFESKGHILGFAKRVLPPGYRGIFSESKDDPKSHEITINSRIRKNVNRVVGHEIGHSVEFIIYGKDGGFLRSKPKGKRGLLRKEMKNVSVDFDVRDVDDNTSGELFADSFGSMLVRPKRTNKLAPNTVREIKKEFNKLV